MEGFDFFCRKNQKQLGCGQCLPYDIKSKEIIKKYNLELLVELGEFANVTRCFKFWSQKGMSEKEIVLEEYIDCLFMILYFCNVQNVSLQEEFPISKEKDLTDTILYLYTLGVELSQTFEKETIKSMLVEILHIANLLKYTEEDLYEGTKKKSLIVQERLKGNY